ncbi:uncharacterized protein LOC116842724 [Odontomachus brunneus]|uniref:uncharacterized protein LOC116842724 n=1 Tax=Odontomachus brunneus TaxID=486640 RepID=UPI0013F2159E|nr:uncharacterized protein LOC116842724 [Odontomachus brunneus]
MRGSLKTQKPTMDFQSVNPLNIRLNMISGNLLPMTANDTSFPILWRVYSVLMWLLQIVLLIALVPGSMYVSTEKFLKDGLVCYVISAETFVIVARIQARRDLMGRLIRRINNILSAADDTMKNVVMTTVKSVETPLMLYWIAGMISVSVWSCLPLWLLFGKDVFYYEDYRLPAAFFNQPLSPRKFLLGNIVLWICSVYMFIKKVGTDVYMVHIVMLITAQYRYIAVKIAMLFQERNEDEHDKTWKIDSLERKTRQMKTLCRHHNALIQ